MGGKRGDVDIVNMNTSVRCTNNAADGVKQCCFANARWACDCQRFTSRHGERNVINDDGVVEFHGEI